MRVGERDVADDAVLVSAQAHSLGEEAVGDETRFLSDTARRGVALGDVNPPAADLVQRRGR